MRRRNKIRQSGNVVTVNNHININVTTGASESIFSKLLSVILARLLK